MFRILTKSLLVVHEPLVEWASRIRLLHLMRDYQTLCVLRQCIGLIGWYLWDENERASAARLQATQAKIAAHDASVKHELLNQRYHMAELMWSDQPGKVRVYRSCLESKEEWGEWSLPACLPLDKAIQREFDRGNRR